MNVQAPGSKFMEVCEWSNRVLMFFALCIRKLYLATVRLTGKLALSLFLFPRSCQLKKVEVKRSEMLEEEGILRYIWCSL